MRNAEMRPACGTIVSGVAMVGCRFARWGWRYSPQGLIAWWPQPCLPLAAGKAPQPRARPRPAAVCHDLGDGLLLRRAGRALALCEGGRWLWVAGLCLLGQRRWCLLQQHLCLRCGRRERGAGLCLMVRVATYGAPCICQPSWRDRCLPMWHGRRRRGALPMSSDGKGRLAGHVVTGFVARERAAALADVAVGSMLADRHWLAQLCKADVRISALEADEATHASRRLARCDVRVLRRRSAVRPSSLCTFQCTTCCRQRGRLLRPMHPTGRAGDSSWVLVLRLGPQRNDARRLVAHLQHVACSVHDGMRALGGRARRLAMRAPWLGSDLASGGSCLCAGPCD